MVSLVIVSHSARLAEGIYELVNQMSQGKTKIALAAGIDDIENPIGTDAVAVMNAVESVYDSSGVLIMVDMGSAILSAEMAVDLLEPEVAKNIRICAAPILEGAISASVAASAGLDIGTVEKEAHSSLGPKYKALNQEKYLSTIDDTEESSLGEDDCVEFQWTVCNPHGIHARPSAAIVNLMSKFVADVEIIHCDERASAKSLNGVSVLGIRKGDTITIRATGSDAKEAVEEFKELARSNFGESVKPDINTESEAINFYSSGEDDDSILGTPVCKGIAAARVAHFTQTIPEVMRRENYGVSKEKQLFEDATVKVSRSLEELINAPDSSEEQKNIFDAHIMMLTDEDLQTDILDNIKSGINADAAVYLSISELAQSFRESNSDYMKAREADVWDIGRQLICELVGADFGHDLVFEEPVILIANELSPSNTARISSEHVKAICLNGGDPCSHSAVIARAKGIPTIFGLEDNLNTLEKCKLVCVDAFEGRVWYQPKPNQYESLSKHYSAHL